MIEKRYGSTQICEITLASHDIEKIVLENILSRGGDPSYDFSKAHPYFIWKHDGILAIRFVQADMLTDGAERTVTLRSLNAK